MSRLLVSLLMCIVALPACADSPDFSMAPNNACAYVTMRVETGKWKYSEADYLETIRVCETHALLSVCRAATDVIEKNNKKSPLNCRPKPRDPWRMDD